MKPLKPAMLYGPDCAPTPPGMPKFDNTCMGIHMATAELVELVTTDIHDDVLDATHDCAGRRARAALWAKERERYL